MSNENHNSTENWRSKLEDLDSLAEETMFDKNASWEKLYARLGGKKRAKKAIWYWAAAACILFALMIPVIFSSNKIHRSGKDAISQRQPEIKAFIRKMPGKKDSIKVVNFVLSEENTITVGYKSNKTGKRTIFRKPVNKIRLYDTVSMQNLVAGTVDNPIKTVDSAAYFAATIPVKKKLPVVHINELGDPVNVPEEVARNSDNRSFLFLKLASQEVYSNSSAPATKDFATINLKTPSN
ncbi:MAG TPA: hypothetical protein VMU83_07240 [Hanamia sp.]|nr:hypothetical protein [Hanamia sp.]